MATSAEYSELVDKLLNHRGDFLKKLHPTEPLTGYAGELAGIRQATDAALSGGNSVGTLFPAVRAALMNYHDSLGETHALLRDLADPLVDYWRGIVHRREADFDNARIAFSRAGELSFFSMLHQAVSKSSPLFARQFGWDPYLFAGQCEQFKFGDWELQEELIEIQQIEFRVVFDHTWKRCVSAQGA